jgi:hypothetical protein
MFSSIEIIAASVMMTVEILGVSTEAFFFFFFLWYYDLNSGSQA